MIPGESVTVMLDKERHLRLSMFGMSEYRKLTGEDILEGITISKEKSLKNLEKLAALLWASLIEEDPNLKYEDIIHMLDAASIISISDKIVLALEIALGVAEKKEENKGTPLAGVNSGPSAASNSDSQKPNSGI